MLDLSYPLLTLVNHINPSTSWLLHLEDRSTIGDLVLAECSCLKRPW